MTDTPIVEIDQLVATDELDRLRSKGGRERMLKARTAAYLLRKRKKRPLKGVRSIHKKKSLIAHNREVDRLARRLIVAAKRTRSDSMIYENAPRQALLAKRKQSILLDGLLTDRSVRWVSIPNRIRSRETRRIEVVDFCFLTNPERTIENLCEVAMAEAECLAAQIDFSDEHCQDIGPWLALAAMRPDMARIFTGGRISNAMSKVIKALNLHKPLNFSFNPNKDGDADVWAFPLKSRRPAGSSTSETRQLDPQAKEKVGGELCNAINSWLSACVNQELSQSGIRYVKTIVGECLDNAERHSRREYENDGDWMITGFMARRNELSKSLFKCQLAFLSVGASISETILDGPDSTVREMEEYVGLHASSMANQSHADQHLRTVYALQDTVTRDHDAALEGRGGTGFRDIVCLFADLAGSYEGQNDAKLAIVSGHTCLHIDHSQCDKVFPLPKERFNIWLNSDNDRWQPPTESSVLELESKFCGTLITMGFTLDPEYLERTVDARDRS